MTNKFPKLVQSFNQIEIDYYDGNGIDFEPYDEFMSEAETQEWLVCWTGNSSCDSSIFKVFGQDGTGGYAAFWLVRQNVDILEQPVVFLGSEGEVGVVSANFYEFIWLFANGIGPYEAIENPTFIRKVNPAFRGFAEEHAPSYKLDSDQIVKKVKAEFPMFEKFIDELCK